MREVITLPQVVCGVERYAHTEKRSIVTKVIDILNIIERHCHYIKQLLLYQKGMENLEATQNNICNYGGILVTSVKNLTINYSQKEKDAEPQKEMEQPTTTEVKAEEKKDDIAAKDEKDWTVREMLYYLVQEAKELFGTPRDILKPYMVAVSMGLIPAMNAQSFNDYFKTDINKATFCKSTSPDAINRYTKEELDYYYTKLARYEKTIL